MNRRTLTLVLAAFAFLFLLAMAACTGCNGCTSCNLTVAWPTWRGSTARSGIQLFETTLGDPNAVSTLHTVWTFTLPSAGGFHSSPVVAGGRVYIGGGNGIFYCLDGNDGHKIWQYPASGTLTQQFLSNPSSMGIASSAAIAQIGNETAVIFGAPDPTYPGGSGLGDGHLFALKASDGSLIWESPAVALLTGTTGSSTTEFHQQIGYSAPLVFNDHVYIGIADHGDDPIQQGKVISVRLSNGTIDTGFNFVATGTRGGGIWGSAAAWEDIFVTTGNSKCWNGGCQSEPSPNHGLSMLRLNKDTGNVIWKQQPVPFSLDNDPDWAAGPAVMFAADCGPALISTQKDGWTWAVQAGPATPGAPSVMWSFPPGPWTTNGFTPADGTYHGDDDYKRPGATWGDVYIGVMGGYDTVTSLGSGQTRLHALNVCGPDNQRVRWIKDIPGAAGGWTYPLGPPTVTPSGMIFVGTSQGHIVAIADPQLHPSLGNRCEDPAIPAANCVALGHRLVPDPWIHDVTLPGSPNDGVFGEPAIANGNLYVATVDGNVYMLHP